MSLLYGDYFYGETSLEDYDYCFMDLFTDCNIRHAKDLILPATTLSRGCYSFMFCGCENLISAPELPALNLYSECYKAMFTGCKSLEESPVLIAPMLVSSCYSYMFQNCISLNKITCLAVQGIPTSANLSRSPNTY